MRIIILKVIIILFISCSYESSFDLIDPKLDKLNLLENFIAEHLFSPSENGHGSWVSMTFDDNGRLIVSDQFGSLYRLEIPPIGEDSIEPKVEELNVDIGYAQGLLWAYNSLYVMVNHRTNEDLLITSGLYRLQDTNQNDEFDKVTLLKELEGSGEHGPHSIVLAPDKESIYVIAGNVTDLPNMDHYRLPPIWQKDNLLPLLRYPLGGGEVNRPPPGGWIAKTDSTGANWELISAGFRNPYDLAFNDAGDLFTYESDKEFDFGMPWYRPTRLYHVTSGSEFGWRTGSSKWSEQYLDNLPPLFDVGPGSPTGLFNGINARFPEKYRKALFGFDWSFGIIYAFHLQPQGASYNVRIEEFLSGAPLPLTSGAIGPDGAMYFLTGGRRLESDLYRVYYENYNKIDLTLDINSYELSDKHQIRRQLELFHEKSDTLAIDFAWANLKNKDRYIRYAARIAIEHQPISHWQDRALNEKNPQVLIQIMLALVRQGDQTLKNQVLDNLMNLEFSLLTETQQIDLLRVFELVLFRMGKPDAEQRSQLISYLNSHFPGGDVEKNQLLSKILVFLGDSQAVEKTLALLENTFYDISMNNVFEGYSDFVHRNPQYGLDIARMLDNMPPVQQIYFATVLSKAEEGWTPEMLEKYFNWIFRAFKYDGGRNYIGYIDNIRRNALENVPKDQYEYYDTISGKDLISISGTGLADTPQPEGPGRIWNLDDALSTVENKLIRRDFKQGENMYNAICSACHMVRDNGSPLGPDLTQISNRFSVRDILEKIIEPNNMISDQFSSTVFHLKDGSTVIGRLMNENEDEYYISQNPFSPQTIREISKENVVRTSIAEVSIMPPGLINRLNEDELIDLIAYLVSGGYKDHDVFNEYE